MQNKDKIKKAALLMIHKLALSPIQNEKGVIEKKRET